MELFAAPINLSKGPFISTRPNRLGEPPLVSLLSWSRGGLRNGCRPFQKRGGAVKLWEEKDELLTLSIN